jgi:hypothetical protein
LSLDFGEGTCWELEDGNEIICEFEVDNKVKILSFDQMVIEQ